MLHIFSLLVTYLITTNLIVYMKILTKKIIFFVTDFPAWISSFSNSACIWSCTETLGNRRQIWFPQNVSFLQWFFFSLKLLLVFHEEKIKKKMNIQCDELWFIPWFIHPFHPWIFPLWNMKRCKYLTPIYAMDERLLNEHRKGEDDNDRKKGKLD